MAVYLPGCGSLYLYDATNEKTAKEARDAFQKVETAALFQHAASQLKGDLTNGQAAAQRLVAAAQDMSLATLIQGTPHKRPWNELDALVRPRVNALLGTEEIANKFLERDDVDAWRRLHSTDLRSINGVRLTLEKLRESYRTRGGIAKNTCQDPEAHPMDEQSPSDDSDEGRTLYPLLEKACKDLADLLTSEEQHRALGLNPENLKKGEVAETYKLLRKLKEARADLKTAQEKLKVKLATLQGEYDSALAAAKQNPTAANLQADLKQAATNLTDYLKSLEDMTKVVGRVKEATGNTVDLDLIQQTIGMGVGYVGDLVQAQVLQTNLSALLTQAIDPAKQPETEADKRAQAYFLLTIRAVDAFARLEEISVEPTKVPSPNALLIGIAYQRYRQSIAKTSEALIDERLAARSAELDATIEELYQLWRASKASEKIRTAPCGVEAVGFSDFASRCKGNRDMELAAATALIAYDHAWSLGQTEQISAVMSDSAVRQRYALEMARVSAQAWFDLLAPALQELVAYGEGGLRQETIGNLISAIGLAAIAGGVY